VEGRGKQLEQDGRLVQEEADKLSKEISTLRQEIDGAWNSVLQQKLPHHAQLIQYLLKQINQKIKVTDSLNLLSALVCNFPRFVMVSYLY
jgi:TATA-binding protein-associated factor Taf7